MKKFNLIICMLWPALSFGQLADSAARLVHMQGAANFRDVGGYKTENNKEVVRNRIFRSAEISKLTDSDLHTFSAKRIHNVIDFRGKKEAALAPDRLPQGTNYLLCSAGSDNLPQLAEMGKLIKNGHFIETLYDSTSVAYFADRYKPLFQQLLTMPDSVSLLYHCTAGRDRTGMATALFLYALQVPMKTIEADFTASNVYLEKKNKELFAGMIKYSGLDSATVMKAVALRPGLLHEFFGAIKNKYGSIENFFEKGLGIGPAQLVILRKKYTI